MKTNASASFNIKNEENLKIKREGIQIWGKNLKLILINHAPKFWYYGEGEIEQELEEDNENFDQITHVTELNKSEKH